MLKALLVILGIVIGIVIGVFLCLRLTVYVAKTKDKNNKKFQAYYDLTIKMINRLVSGKPIFFSLKENGYKNIAIYGCADMGRLLNRLLSKEEYVVKCFIDRRLAGQVIDNLEVKSPSDVLEDVDCVIVTPFLSFDEIVRDMGGNNLNSDFAPLDALID